jgi:L-ascorbate metabolism protein UlaG (beta-lactamase superfamily)
MATRREFLGEITSALPIMVLQPARPRRAAVAASASRLRAQRLSWAGVKVEGEDTTLLVDPWITTSIWGGAWTRPVVPIEVDTPTQFALITHAHSDHYDPVVLRQVLAERGSVVCHEALAPYIASHDLRILSQRLYQPRRVGEFVVTPVPAVDGDGEEQVSWVIAGAARRIFHGGDTMWHGHWWTVAEQYGPFDVVFLPINGAVVKARVPAVEMPSSLTPAQAVAAAEILRARTLVPIHYGLHSPGVYEEQPDVVAVVKRLCRERGVGVQLVDEGAWVQWPAPGSADAAER